MTIGTNESSTKCMELLSSAFKGNPPVTFRFWDGNELQSRATEPAICFQSPTAFWALVTNPNSLTLGELYAKGAVSIQGNIVDLARLQFSTDMRPKISRLRLASQLFSTFTRAENRRSYYAGRREAKNGHSNAIDYHYHHPVAFWKLLLDPLLQYTCGYFVSEETNLALAQEAKVKYLFTKIQLSRGDRLLDVGCGWGGLLESAAREGAEVHGITLSHEQYEYISSKSNTPVDLIDIHHYPRSSNFDKIAAIGVIEHIGEGEQTRFLRTIHDLLRPGGLAVVQGITRHFSYGESAGREFVRRYVFPEASLSTISTTVMAAEAAGLEVVDVEDLSQHYPPTLRAWHENLQEHRQDMLEYCDEFTWRVFDYYIAGFIACFEARRFGLYQTVVRRPGGLSKLPLRRHLYGDSATR